MFFQDRKELPLWEEEPPVSKLDTHKEDDPVPTITMYAPPPWKRSNKAVVIFPGGGYSHLSVPACERYAQVFNEEGHWAFIVSYRLGKLYPAQLYDALRAVRLVRSAAEELGYSPDKIGVMGSSAGGHLAAMCAVHYDKGIPGKDEKEIFSARPDFSIHAYPVISGVSNKSHKASFINLFKTQKPEQKDLMETSAELHVNKTTPPAFLWHTFADTLVPMENSLLYAKALRENDIPFELHIYPLGSHGLGTGGIARHPWTKDCCLWLSMI